MFQVLLNASFKLLKTQERKNPKVALMYLKKVVGCLKPQVLLGNEASLSCIYDRLFQKLPLTYSMRKFIMIGNGHMCHTKGRFL